MGEASVSRLISTIGQSLGCPRAPSLARYSAVAAQRRRRGDVAVAASFRSCQFHHFSRSGSGFGSLAK